MRGSSIGPRPTQQLSYRCTLEWREGQRWDGLLSNAAKWTEAHRPEEVVGRTGEWKPQLMRARRVALVVCHVPVAGRICNLTGRCMLTQSSSAAAVSVTASLFDSGGHCPRRMRKASARGAARMYKAA